MKYLNIELDKHLMSIAINNNLPVLSNEGGLSAYLEQIKRFPMLDAEEEYMLAKNWKTTGNIKSAEKLVTSHLRLVAKRIRFTCK